jgi:NAD(P)-dependent dehydrogenase (short-subunit alcohol dehydrogenase family)
VAVADLDGAGAARVAQSLGGGVLGTPIDVAHEASVQDAVASVRKVLGPIDILVNSAGIIRKAWVAEMSEATWDQVLDINLKGTFLCAKAVLPDMIAKTRGRIINIASIAGKVGEPTASAYSASKFGVIGFTRSLALEVARHDILVNAICPGPIATPLGEQGWRDGAAVEGVEIDRIMTRVNGRSPLGRLGTVEQVAKMALFITSDDCDFTTGSAFNVDGGIIMT